MTLPSNLVPKLEVASKMGKKGNFHRTKEVINQAKITEATFLFSSGILGLERYFT